MEEHKSFIFLPPPCSETSEEDSEIFTTWIEDKIFPQLEKHHVPYRSEDDFSFGNRQQQQNEFLCKCTNLLIPVCPMICKPTNLAWLSAHFSESKPPIILLPPVDVAQCMTLKDTGRLQNYHAYNCKTDRQTEKAFILIAKHLNSIDVNQLPLMPKGKVDQAAFKKSAYSAESGENSLAKPNEPAVQTEVEGSNRLLSPDCGLNDASPRKMSESSNSSTISQKRSSSTVTEKDMPSYLLPDKEQPNDEQMEKDSLFSLSSVGHTTRSDHFTGKLKMVLFHHPVNVYENFLTLLGIATATGVVVKNIDSVHVLSL